MMTPGQASRIACWISLLTLTSQDGRCPLFGACWRRWICMMLAPALKADLASRAISSGVTGTWCCLGSVSTPFSAQVMTALSLMKCLRCRDRETARSCGRELAGFLRPSAKVRRPTAAIDRKIARAGEDRARLQAIEPADRMAEMGGVGIAD